jgi:hypothetical protein
MVRERNLGVNDLQIKAGGIFRWLHNASLYDHRSNAIDDRNDEMRAWRKLPHWIPEPLHHANLPGVHGRERKKHQEQKCGNGPRGKRAAQIKDEIALSFSVCTRAKEIECRQNPKTCEQNARDEQ